MDNFPLPRLDIQSKARNLLLPHCRLALGEIWEDPTGLHRVGCLDASDPAAMARLAKPVSASLALHDPPYNQVAFEEQSVSRFIEWCGSWIHNTDTALADDSSLYVWLGADQNRGFQPLPDFMIMMRGMSSFRAKSYITMRNQRGYGTQGNWMAVRQELLYYIKGKPEFEVAAEYTDIPKILRGYYKKVGGEVTDNLSRGKSPNIRAGNVWVDIQQVFYRMEENVAGCFAQKPLAAIQRIVSASSQPGNLVLDFFAHAGTTLLACERTGRKCATADLDPLFCEISIRRLLHFRSSGKTGWQNSNPFAAELGKQGISGFDEKGYPVYK
ncbi:MAG: site-specific DNA-methyltransferase [Spirochaetaceae bacterium]|nr:MAG: site-specific DNA-methyltransferase [Spirochaetaceae bacterium]